MLINIHNVKKIYTIKDTALLCNAHKLKGMVTMFNLKIFREQKITYLFSTEKILKRAKGQAKRKKSKLNLEGLKNFL